MFSSTNDCLRQNSRINKYMSLIEIAESKFPKITLNIFSSKINYKKYIKLLFFQSRPNWNNIFFKVDKMGGD